jgi:hypothetical protein
MVAPTSAAIAAAGTAVFTVTFQPDSTGFKEATLTFKSDTSTQVVDLTGVGLPIITDFAVAPTSLDFAAVEGGTQPQIFAVTNLLSDFITVVIGDPSDTHYTVTSSDKFILFPTGDALGRDSQNVTVVFGALETDDPQTIIEGTVQVGATLGAIELSGKQVDLRGRVLETDLRLEPAAIDFGEQTVGVESTPPVSVSITNNGSTVQTVYAGLIEGNHPGDFVILDPVAADPAHCLDPNGDGVQEGTQVGVGSACYFEVAAKPTVAEARDALIHVFTSASATAFETRLDVVGQDATAVIDVAPLSVDLGDVPVFIGSSGTVTVTNIGETDALDVTGFTFDGPHYAPEFSASVVGGLPATLNPGDSVAVTVTSLPLKLGIRATTLTINSSAGDAPPVTITADSELGTTAIDEGTPAGTVTPGDIYLVPVVGDTPGNFWRSMTTALPFLATPILLPADRFVFMEGAPFLPTNYGQYLDYGTNTWVTVETEADLVSSEPPNALLQFIAPENLPVQFTFPAEGQYTIHFGFDLIRNNQRDVYPYFSLDAARTVIYGPQPSIDVPAITRLDGTHNGADDSANLLIDTTTDFLAALVEPGMQVYNITDGSNGDIDVVEETQITAVLDAGTGAYLTGTHEGGIWTGSHEGATSATVLLDTTGVNFVTLGVEVGDIVENTTDGSQGVVLVVAPTQLTGALIGGSDNQWEANDGYRVTFDTDYLLDTTVDFSALGILPNDWAQNITAGTFDQVLIVGTNALTFAGTLPIEWNNGDEYRVFRIIPPERDWDAGDAYLIVDLSPDDASGITLILGAAHPAMSFDVDEGSSTTEVEIYIWSEAPGGALWYLDTSDEWQTATAIGNIQPRFQGDVSTFGGAITIGDPWTNYAISGTEGLHTITMTIDSIYDATTPVLNERVFEVSLPVTVATP